MKKLLILFVALFSIVGTMPGNAASQRIAPAREQKTKRSIMELPLFERAVLIIKKFETLHKPKHCHMLDMDIKFSQVNPTAVVAN